MAVTALKGGRLSGGRWGAGGAKVKPTRWEVAIVEAPAPPVAGLRSVVIELPADVGSSDESYGVQRAFGRAFVKGVTVQGGSSLAPVWRGGLGGAIITDRCEASGDLSCMGRA